MEIKVINVSNFFFYYIFAVPWPLLITDWVVCEDMRVIFCEGFEWAQIVFSSYLYTYGWTQIVWCT